MKAVKALLIILVIGAVLLGIGYAAIGGADGLYKLSGQGERTAKTVTEEQVVTSMQLHVSSDEVEFVAATDDKFKIEYYDYEEPVYTYSYDNGCAVFKSQPLSASNWLSLFRINTSNDERKFVVYVPSTLNDKMDINISSGDLSSSSITISVNSLYIDVSSGDVSISNITADNVDCHTSSGNIALGSVTTDKLNCKTSSGSITLNNATATTTTLKTSSGDININDSTIGTVTVDVSSGGMSGDNIGLDSLSVDISSGPVNLKLAGAVADYSIRTEISSGNTTLLDKDGKTLLSTGDDTLYGSGSKTVDIDVSSGNVLLKFLG